MMLVGVFTESSKPPRQFAAVIEEEGDPTGPRPSASSNKMRVVLDDLNETAEQRSSKKW
jgi:hypothetical protein